MAGWALHMAVLLAVLAGAVGDYQNFLRQHVDYPRTTNLNPQRYCETMMARRQVLGPGGTCKTTNTFVHATARELAAACPARADRNMVYSTSEPKDITVCNHRGGNTRPPCKYRMQQLQHYVLVKCEGGVPVHLEDTVAFLPH